MLKIKNKLFGAIAVSTIRDAITYQEGEPIKGIVIKPFSLHTSQVTQGLYKGEWFTKSQNFVTHYDNWVHYDERYKEFDKLSKEGKENLEKLTELYNKYKKEVIILVEISGILNSNELYDTPIVKSRKTPIVINYDNVITKDTKELAGVNLDDIGITTTEMKALLNNLYNGTYDNRQVIPFKSFIKKIKKHEETLKGTPITSFLSSKFTLPKKQSYIYPRITKENKITHFINLSSKAINPETGDEVIDEYTHRTSAPLIPTLILHISKDLKEVLKNATLNTKIKYDGVDFDLGKLLIIAMQSRNNQVFKAIQPYLTSNFIKDIEENIFNDIYKSIDYIWITYQLTYISHLREDLKGISVKDLEYRLQSNDLVFGTGVAKVKHSIDKVTKKIIKRNYYPAAHRLEIVIPNIKKSDNLLDTNDNTDKLLISGNNEKVDEKVTKHIEKIEDTKHIEKIEDNEHDVPWELDI